MTVRRPCDATPVRCSVSRRAPLTAARAGIAGVWDSWLVFEHGYTLAIAVRADTRLWWAGIADSSARCR